MAAITTRFTLIRQIGKAFTRNAKLLRGFALCKQDV
jgi:hypothetical protein